MAEDYHLCTYKLSSIKPWEAVAPSEHFACRVHFSSLGGEDFLPPSEPSLNICTAEVIGSLGGLHLIFERDIQSGSKEN